MVGPPSPPQKYLRRRSMFPRPLFQRKEWSCATLLIPFFAGVLRHRACSNSCCAFRNASAAVAAALIGAALSVSQRVPSALNPIELVSRIAGRIAAVMATERGHRNRLGALDWPAGASGLYPPDRSWRVAEETLMARQMLQRILEQGKA